MNHNTTSVTDKEAYDLMAQFERDFSHLRLDREERSEWRRGNVYQNGEANALFLAYRKGYTLGKFMMAREVDNAGNVV